MMKGDIRRRTADASAIGALRGSDGIPRDERVPERNEGVGEHVRTRFQAGL